MRPPLAWAAFGLASVFAAYWAYVDGFQVISAITFATRIDAPAALWILTSLYGLHLVAACVAWLIALLALSAARPGRGMILGLVAAAASWPWLALLYARLSDS